MMSYLVPRPPLFRFSLYYYCDRTFKDNIVKKDTKLTIDTSVKRVERTPEFDAEDEVEEPPLESLIRTKYELYDNLFCSTALISAGWVQSTILCFALSTSSKQCAVY